MKERFSRAEKKILSILKSGGRKTARQLSKLVGCTPSEVSAKLRAMKSKGIISESKSKRNSQFTSEWEGKEE